MPAETEHDRVPTWTRRGCASATTAASTAMPTTDDQRNLGDMFFPSLNTQEVVLHTYEPWKQAAPTQTNVAVVSGARKVRIPIAIPPERATPGHRRDICT